MDEDQKQWLLNTAENIEGLLKEIETMNDKVAILHIEGYRGIFKFLAGICVLLSIIILILLF